MTQGERFHSIDVLKGIMVLFILFANALCLPDILPFFSDSGSTPHYYELSVWAISGFIFMFGMTVPFSITKKINNGLSPYEISRGIFSKSLILITIGILIVNTHRVNADLTGFNSYIWASIMFCAIFLVWVRYPNEENKFFTVTGLRFLGLALLVFLIFRFRSGTFENGGTLITGWWEVPALLGWGYLITAFTYLAFRNSFAGSAVIWLFFLLLNIATKLGMTHFMDPFRPFIGPITDGYVPFIMLSGQLASLILKKYSGSEFKKTVTGLALYGSISLITGTILKQTIFMSLEYFNPAITFIITGVIVLVFLLLHWIVDEKNYGRWFGFFKPAGKNYLTAYLFPYLIYNLLWLCGVPVFFFRQNGTPLINILISAVLAILLMFLSTIITRMNIRLKI
jgi:heparan-alpha-glucosaminide N-acetyltransferase